MRVLKICAVMLIFAVISAASWSMDQHGLTVGDKAPDFSGLTQSGTSFNLFEEINKGPTIVLFYRGGWCYFCNLQLQEYQSQMSKLKALNINLVAISVDKVEKVLETVSKQKLEFPIISNPDASLLEMYKVTYNVPDTLAEEYKIKYDIDLKAASGRDDYLIAVSATYVIDETGIIVYAHVDEDYKIRPKAQEVIEVIAKLKQGNL